MKPTLAQQIDFALWRRVHRLPRPFVRWWQSRRLKEIVRIAYDHVPMYRKLYDRHGVKPEDIRTLDDVTRLPITSKQLFRQYPREESMDMDFPSRLYEWKETSGSTGEPFKIPWNTVAYFRGRFDPGRGGKLLGHFPYLFLSWLGFSPSGLAEKLRVAEMRVHRNPKSRHFLHIPVADFREHPSMILQRLEEFKPDVLDSRTTVLVELARLAEKIPAEERPMFSFLVVHGEAVTSGQREYLKKIFGSEPYERYGLEEVGDVAVDCAFHSNPHLHEESFAMEILDSKDMPVAPGKEGRIVLTHFYNHVMPFIRYDTGDRGVLIDEPCPCGVRARRLKVYGRGGGVLMLDGKPFNNVEFEVMLGRFSDRVLRYQLAKTGPRALELRLIPAGSFSGSDLEALAREFEEKFGFAPEIKIVSEIQFTPGGKTNFIVDETGASRES